MSTFSIQFKYAVDPGRVLDVEVGATSLAREGHSQVLLAADTDNRALVLVVLEEDHALEALTQAMYEAHELVSDLLGIEAPPPYEVGLLDLDGLSGALQVEPPAPEHVPKHAGVCRHGVVADGRCLRCNHEWPDGGGPYGGGRSPW